MSDKEEHLARLVSWTIRDLDGVYHRAVQQYAGSMTWVITTCPWWLTHNVSGQKTSVRTDRVPTCLECTALEIADIGKPKCAHCGLGKEVHNHHMHAFEATA